MSLAREIAALQRLTVPELRRRYTELFGEATRSGNRTWLVRRLAWRLQALAEGGLSERAQRRAAELAQDADLRVLPPRAFAVDTDAAPPPKTLRFQQDERLPPPGSVLTRQYKGRDVQVLVRADGFEYAGRVYPSLSAVAREVTGTHTNGFLFFRLNQPGASA